MLVSARLAVCSVPRSRSVLCVVSTAAASSRLVARPPLSVLGRVCALSASTVAAPIRAAAIRELDVMGVVAFVQGLRVDSDDCKKLVEQKIDGAALLETSVDELRSYGMSGGAAHTIVRGIAPAVAEVQKAIAEAVAQAQKTAAKAVAEVQEAAAKAAAEAQKAAAKAAAEASVVTLEVYPPLRGSGGRNNPKSVRLTPEDFRIKYVLSNAPLQLVSKDGAVLEDIMTLEYAVESMNRLPSATLRCTRSFDDDVRDLRGFVANVAEALEQTTTRALCSDASLKRNFGPLVALNFAEHFTVSSRSGGELLQEIEVDGLVVGARVVFLNSTKQTPSLKHVDEVAADAKKLQDMLALHITSLSTNPHEVKAKLNDIARLPIVPYLSGNSFSAAVEAKCREKGVGIVRPSGEGFVVEPPHA